MNFDCGDAGQEAVGHRPRGGEARKARDLDRRRATRLRDHKNAFGRVLRPDERIFRLGIQPDGAGEFAVIDPLAQHELILVLDMGVDEVAEEPPLDSVVRLRRVVGRAVRHAAANEPVVVVAAAGLSLAGDGLASRIDPADVRPDRTAQTLRITRPVRIHILEVVQLLRRDSTRGAVGVRGERKRNAVAPPSAHLGGEQLRIDPLLVRLQEILEADHIGPDHLEDGETAIAPQFRRLRHEVILGLVQQDEQPGLARLLVIGLVALRARRESSSC